MPSCIVLHITQSTRARLNQQQMQTHQESFSHPPPSFTHSSEMMFMQPCSEIPDAVEHNPKQQLQKQKNAIIISNLRKFKPGTGKMLEELTLKELSLRTDSHPLADEM
jgi:hypothetical protein